MTRKWLMGLVLAGLVGAGTGMPALAQNGGSGGVQASAADEDEGTHDGMGPNHIATYLVEERFDELDRIADTFRREKTREKGGNWKLYELYEDLDAPEKTDKDSLEHLAHLEKWVQVRPQSITARVALATSLMRWAWVARGNGSARTVTDAMFAQFAERSQKALQVLEAARDLPVMCPQWFDEMLRVGTALNWDQGRMHAVLERAVQFEPEYFYSDQKYANYLLPKWDGQPGDAARFAKEAADHLGGDQGDVLYFELTRTVVRRGGGNESAKSMDWARVQRGYGALNAAYGETKKNDNELALLAYLFEDRTAAQKQFALLGERWSRSVWRDKKYYDRARDWAAGHGLAEQRVDGVDGARTN